MTPKEKAQDLWVRYYELIDDNYSNEAAKKMAKEYAQIAVDEIIDAIKHEDNRMYYEIKYWEEVKQEIKNL